MEIYHLRKFWFPLVSYPDAAVHKHFHTVRFANRPNVDAQIWPTYFVPGANYAGGAVTALGWVVTGIKSYSFLNDRSEIEVVEPTDLSASVRIERVVDITFAFHCSLATGKAEGIIYYWSP